MAILYPGAPPGSATDVFTVPSAPEGTPLSEDGGTGRDHPELHGDEGAAIEALESWAALRTHDHSGDPANVAKGPKLLQVNTHGSPDTDSSPTALHHTIGTGANQAAAGNHAHPVYVPSYQTCTSLTRPTGPFLGMTIFETDTNATRCWFKPTGQSSPIWQLVPVTLIPVLRIESRTTVAVPGNVDHICGWTDILEDWIINNFFHPTVSTTDITVTEPGLYDVNAAVNWDPQKTFHDQSMIQVTVNGADVARKNWEYIRGYSYTPGFSQTNEIHFPWRFLANDVLRVAVRHNATVPSWLYWNNTAPNRQVNHLELVFRSP